MTKKPKVTAQVNGGPEVDITDMIGHNGAGERVRSFVERIERLEEERAELAEDVARVLKDAEDAGFEKKIIKTIVKIRKDKEQFEQDLEKVNLYLDAMGEQLNFSFSPSKSALDELSEAA